jgi:hypothetical protein
MLRPIRAAGWHEIRSRKSSDMFCIAFSWFCKAYKDVKVSIGKSKWTNREAKEFAFDREDGPASMKQSMHLAQL